MSDMKCPFCQQELEIVDLDVQLLGCENQNCKHSIHYDTVSTKELWQELIRTRKALDIAVDAINAGKTLADIAGFKMLVAGLEKAIEQITSLEQKD